MFLWGLIVILGIHAYHAADSTSYMLPTSVYPEHYNLELITNLGEEGNFDFNGKVQIKIQCLRPTTNITLHSKDLDLTEHEITVKDVTKEDSPERVKTVNFEYVKEHDLFSIQLVQELKEGRKYEVIIPFSGKLQDGLTGYYRSSYVDSATKEKKWLATTQFEPTDARRAFPCFDEPAMKATYRISLGRKEQYSSISNMPVLNSEPIANQPGWVWDRYEESVPMSTYLVAFIVSDFDFEQSNQSSSNNVTFRTWARKDAIEQVHFASDIGPKCLSYYESFFKIAYPLPKMDMIAIPDFSAGAMENWGLVTYRETYLLYNPNTSSVTNKHSIASVIAHELAHQWFGNLVTMRWWTDLWLNEGFATYMAGLAVHELYPQWNSLNGESVDNLLAVFSFDGLKTSHPVSVPVGNPKEINEIFDTISYKKGSFLIRMMSHFLGLDNLRKGVSAYLNKHQYGNAEQDDLWQSLSEQAHLTGALPSDLSVKTIMDSWTLQTGYPLITVTRNYDNRTATLTQERFLRDSIKVKSVEECWWVPISYTTQEQMNFKDTMPKQWLSCPTETEAKVAGLTDANHWVLFNIQAAGLYRVNYDERNWNLLISTLNSDSYKDIPLLNRVLLIDDSANLAWVGSLNYTTHFDILEYLSREEEYLAWKAAMRNIESLSKVLRRTPAYGAFKNYMRKLLTPVYKRLGGLTLKETTPTDNVETVKYQIMIASSACKYDVADCSANANRLFAQWQKNSSVNPIPKNLRSVVYCNAIRLGGEKEWFFMWKQYLESNTPTEKNTFLDALACTREIWLLGQYLEWSIKDGSGIRRQDSAQVFGGIGRNDVGYYIARNFLENKLGAIHLHLSTSSRRLSRYISVLADQMIDDQDYISLKNFTESNRNYFSESKQGVKQALETVELNIQWQKKHYSEVDQLLTKYYKL